MSSKETPLGVVSKGALAGIVGTGVLTLAMQQVPRLLRAVGHELPKRGIFTGAGGGGKSEAPVEKLAIKVAEGVFDKRLNRKEKQAAGQFFHWAYGAGWGSLYGIMQSTIRLPKLVHGTILAGWMILAAATAMPFMQLVPPPKDLPRERVFLQSLYILFFAWTTALTFERLSPRRK